jgi:hypothetical protein
MKPLFDVVERLKISGVVDDDDAVSATVITGSNSTESLLTSSIPLKIMII